MSYYEKYGYIYGGLYMNNSKVLELLGHLFLTSVTGGMWLIVLLIYHLTKK